MKLLPLRQHRFSLRARATSWYVGLLAVALVVFSFSIYFGIQTYLKNTLQRGLKSTADTIGAEFLARLPEKGPAWVLGEIRESYASAPSDHFVRVSAGDAVLYQTPDMHDPTLQISEIALPRLSGVGAFHRQHIHGETVMIYSLPYPMADGKVYEIEAGTSLSSMEQTLRSLTKVLLLSTVVILLCATLGGYSLMNQPLRPLVLLTEKAAKIGQNNLGARLPVTPTGDELERLTHSLNGMIARLEEALDHNRRFSADASHELRTPLTIIRGEMEEILQLEDLPALAVDNLVSTLDEIDRMSRIVNSLMAITRIDAGGERMDMKAVNLSALVATTAEHMKLLAEEKGISLHCTCEGNVLIDADPLRIKQVLVNLIDNAIKYTPAVEADTAAAAGRIEVTVSTEGAFAHLQIADQGVGIAPETLPLVFDRFFRADLSRSRGAGGVGLGLAIVKAIVTAHDGTVSISSTPGAGSTVVVQLPLAFRPVAHDGEMAGAYVSQRS